MNRLVFSFILNFIKPCDLTALYIAMDVKIYYFKSTRLPHRKSYLIIMYPNSREQFTKIEIMSIHVTRFEYYSE